MQAVIYDSTMTNRIPVEGSACPITSALDIIGDKWSLLIVRDIVFKRKHHYREFLTSPEKISTNILANRLKTMEETGLLEKTKDPDNLSKFIYRLTEKGKDLIPIILELVRWSQKYDPQPGVQDNIINGAPARLLSRFDTERAVLMAEILGNIKD